MKKSSFLIVLPLFILLLVGGVYYFQRTHQSVGVLQLHGNVDIRQVELGFRVPGRITVMHYEEGDAVAKDALLAELDKAPYMHDLDNQKAQLEQATANFEKLKTGNRPEEIQQAESLVKQREATFNNAEVNLERQKDLVKRKLASQQAYDDAFTQMKEAQALLKSAQEGLALAKEGFRIEDIQNGKAALDAAKARFDTAQTNLEDTAILAPEPGTILTRIQEPGAIVAAGSPVYSLALSEPVWVRTYVPEVDLGRLKPGMPAQVFTDTYPNKPLSGKIGYISPQAEFTPKNIETKEIRSDLVYRVRLTVDDPENILRQGMPVTVKINVSP